jgi:hypothetical protein
MKRLQHDLHECTAKYKKDNPYNRTYVEQNTIHTAIKQHLRQRRHIIEK